MNEWNRFSSQFWCLGRKFSETVCFFRRSPTSTISSRLVDNAYAFVPSNVAWFIFPRRSTPPLKSKHILKDPRSLTTKFWRMSKSPRKKNFKYKEREKRVLLFLYIFGPSLIYFAYQKCLFTLFMFFSSSLSVLSGLHKRWATKYIWRVITGTNKLINSFELRWNY